MRNRLALTAAFFGVLVATPCAAQDAVESATILSGVGERTGAASRSLGGAATGAMDGAAEAIRATRSGRAGVSRRSNRGGNNGGRNLASVGYTIPADIDPLENFAVPTYRLSNGLQLRVSGTFIAIPPTSCVSNCEALPPA